jgi:hypothetical protein
MRSDDLSATKPTFLIRLGMIVASGVAFAFLVFATPAQAVASTIAYNDLSTFQAAAGSLTLIDFDTVPGGGAAPASGDIGNTYASLGVTFPTGNSFLSVFSGPVSSPNGWISNTRDGTDVVFSANFSSLDVFAVGVHNVLNGGLPSGSDLFAYGPGMTLLGSVLSDSNGNTKDFFGLIATSPITSIQVRVYSPNGWGLDNLYFGTAAAAAAPEPASLTLLALGLTGLGARRRRQRKA